MTDTNRLLHPTVPLAGPNARVPARRRRGLWGLLCLWQARAAGRAHLARLDARMLRDMGLTPDDARLEAAKPFWRA